MSYVGNTPISAAFLTDTFSGTGSATAFTMTVAPANTSSIIVAVTGVLQDPSTYSVSGTTLTFSAAPPTGTSNISVRYLGIPASGVTTTAYRTVTNFTATAGQTSFSTPSYTVGYIDVYRNGVRLVSTDYTATTGTTVVLNNACTVGDAVVTESFYVSSVLNALPQTGGTLTGQLVVNGATGQNPLITQVNSTEVMRIDSAGNVGIGAVPSTSGANARALEFNYGNISTYGGTEFDVAANAYIVGSGWIYKTTAAATLFQQAGGVFSFQTAASGTVGTSASFTERMRIDNTGVITSPLGGMQVISGTAQATTSGTVKDFTSIPSWVKKITVMFQGVSTNGASVVIIQLGTGSTTYTTSGYLGSTGSHTTYANFTTGIATTSVRNAAYVNHGAITITNITGNSWVASGTIGNSESTVISYTGSSIALGAALTAVRITTVNGTDVFDAGTVNILYE